MALEKMRRQRHLLDKNSKPYTLPLRERECSLNNDLTDGSEYATTQHYNQHCNL